MNITTVAIIQARMGSTRLPGKVLRDLCGITVLGHVIRRVARCKLVDKTVVATSTLPADDPIAKEAAAHSAAVFRGSEEDVLSRYYGAAIQSTAEVIVRVTADCPLFDPAILCEMLELFHGRNVPSSTRPLDYLSNTLGERTFPRGLDAEVFTMDALAKANALARDPWEREHVTPYIYSHPQTFRLEGYRQAMDQSMQRWTLDTEEDWALIRAIYEALGRADGMFVTQDVIDYLRVHPELMAINAHVRQKQPTASRSG